MFGIIWCLLLLVLFNNFVFECDSYPATSTEGVSHIVSYAHLRRSQREEQHVEIGLNDFEEDDNENLGSNLTQNDKPELGDALRQLYGRFAENSDISLRSLENMASTRENYQPSVQDNEISYESEHDDLMNDELNTLESGFGNNEQHESPKNDTMWQRVKQSIPVLESVRHLVNSVRDGHLNHTEHLQRNHTLLSEMQPLPEQNTSMAIETEEEREKINGSSDLQFLEVLGSIGSKLWGFLSNIRQLFAASAGSASAALSASSSSSSS